MQRREVTDLLSYKIIHQENERLDVYQMLNKIITSERFDVLVNSCTAFVWDSSIAYSTNKIK